MLKTPSTTNDSIVRYVETFPDEKGLTILVLTTNSHPLLIKKKSMRDEHEPFYPTTSLDNQGQGMIGISSEMMVLHVIDE